MATALKMILDTANSGKPEPWTDPQFVENVLTHTKLAYRRLQEPSCEPKSGYCLPVAPEVRMTEFPTGGVVGRHLARAIDGRYPPPLSYSSSARTSIDSEERLSTNMGDGSDSVLVPLQLLDGQQTAAGKQPSPLAGVRATFAGLFYKSSERLAAPSSLNATSWAGSTDVMGNRWGDNHALGGSHVSPPSGQTFVSRPLRPEDMQFLIQKLYQHAAIAEEEVLMIQLIPVHEGRPGENILRIHPRTEMLYACIPRNPYAPESYTGENEYKLSSYDSALAGMASVGRPVKSVYPAPDYSSLSNCNHCGVPDKVLNNDVLCPYHAYYLATGKTLPFYQFCALVELELLGFSIMTGWWTMDDMVQFVDALTARLNKWRFLENSLPMDDRCWTSHASPFGAIGEPVPVRARGRTAISCRAEEDAIKAARQTLPATFRAEQTMGQIADTAVNPPGINGQVPSKTFQAQPALGNAVDILTAQVSLKRQAPQAIFHFQEPAMHKTADSQDWQSDIDLHQVSDTVAHVMRRNPSKNGRASQLHSWTGF